METKIIVCYHKEFEHFANEVLMPLHVGKAISQNTIADIKCDNTGDNISFKNGNYCELTGMYWLWKNIEADNYGLFHYRRFLDIKNKYKKEIYPSLINLSDWSKENIEALMNEYDVILPKKSKFKLSVYDRYSKDHYKKDIDTVIDIIKKDYPQYLNAIKSIYRNEEYSCNTFIMKKDIFNQYCAWLFDILDKAEKKIDISNYDSYQSRIYGFLSERMLNIFIEYKKQTNPDFKIKHVKPIMINPEPIKHFKFVIGEFINYPNKYHLNLLGIKYTKNKK